MNYPSLKVQKISIQFITLSILLFINSSSNALTVVSLNTEWLWDTVEPHEGRIVGFSEEESIRPPSSREYVLETYAIAKTLEAVNADIVGLIEIENEEVAREINQYFDEKWSVVFLQGRDSYTGQDVAILTRLEVIPNTKTTFPDITGKSMDGTITKKPSKVLGVGLKDGDIKYFVVVAHLISKRGSNDKKRYAQADAIRKSVIANYDAYDHFIVLGDMNDLPSSDVLQRLKGKGDNKKDLVQPADVTGDDADYSYVYDNKKQLIDHILVDEELAEDSEFTTIPLPEAITDHRAVIFTTAR